MKKHNNYINYETKGIINIDFLFKEYMINHRSTMNIAREIGCEHQTICHYLRKYHIKIRPRKIACKGIKHGKRSVVYCNNMSKSHIDRFKQYHTNAINYYINKWKHITQLQWAWISGFWEGEGCLYIRTRQFSKNQEGTITITQKEINNLTYIKNLLKTGSIYRQEYDSTYVHKYSLHRGDAVKVFLQKIIPYIHSPKRLRQINKLGLKK